MVSNILTYLQKILEAGSEKVTDKKENEKDITSLADVSIFMSDKKDEIEDTNNDEFISSDIKTAQENPTQEINNDEKKETEINKLLNNIYADNQVVSTLDIDGDGVLSDDEKTKFEKYITGYSDNTEDLTENDINKAYDDIKNGTFKYGEEELPEDIEQPEDTDTTNKDDKTQGAANNNSASRSGGAGGSGGASRSGGAGGGGDSSYDAGNINSGEKNIDNMNKEELEAELTKANSELDDKKSKLDELLNNSELDDLKEAEDEAYEEYQEQLQEVDEELAKQLDEIKTNIDEKQKEIDTKEKEIADQETTVSENENKYNNAVTTRQTLESTLSSLQSVDTSNMDDAQKADLQSKISSCSAKLSEAKSNEEAAKKEWDESKDKLEELKKEKEDLISGEGGLNDLNSQMTDKENEISEKYPEIDASRQAYDEAKEAYNEAREKRDSELVTAKAEVQQAQDRVNEIQTKISQCNDRETVSEFMLDGLTDDTRNAIELAFQELFAGVHETGNNSGEVLKYGAGKGVPWCAAFVSWLYRKGQNNMDCPLNFSAAVSGLRDQAKKAGYYSDKSSYMPVPGDIMIQKNNASHTGLVVAVEGNTIYTIEGNSGDKVTLRKYTVGNGRWNKISGWIRMNEWTGGSSNIPGDTYLSWIKKGNVSIGSSNKTV